MFLSKTCLVAVLLAAAPADAVPAKPDTAKISVRKLKDPPAAAGLDAAAGIKEFADAKALAELGQAAAKQLAEQVNFQKEKIVRVTYQTGGPPFGVAGHELKAGKEPGVVFVIVEPKVNVRGRALKFGCEYFAMPRDVPATFGGAR